MGSGFFCCCFSVYKKDSWPPDPGATVLTTLIPIRGAFDSFNVTRSIPPKSVLNDLTQRPSRINSNTSPNKNSVSPTINRMGLSPTVASSFNWIFIPSALIATTRHQPDN